MSQQATMSALPAAVGPLPTVFMFSGQGSHYFQMGRDLFTRHVAFRRCMEEMDEVVQDLAGQSVVRALYDPARGKGDRFDRLLLSSPSIFMVEFALVNALIERDVIPDCVMGASLGSFAAAAIAGCWSRDEALQIVVKQSQIVEERCEPGGMIVVMGDSSLLQRTVLATHAELAATSLPSHFTVAAPERNLRAIEQYLTETRTPFQRLPVKYAFHSRWIDEARAGIVALGAGTRLRAPKIPLVCCARGRQVSQLPSDHIWTVMREPIRLWETIGFLEKAGPHKYVDVGPAASLATVVKYAKAQESLSSVHATLSPFGDNWTVLQPLRPGLRG